MSWSGTAADALSFIEGLHARFGGEIQDVPNQTTWTGDIPPGEIDVDGVKQFTAAGHRAVLELRRGQWLTTITSAGSAAFDFRVDGSWEDALEDEDKIETAQSAIESNDLDTLLSTLTTLGIKSTLTFIHDPASAGYQWIRRENALVESISGPEWLGAVSALVGDDLPPEIVVEDALSSYVRCAAFALRGPMAPSLAVGEVVDLPEYRRAWLSGDQSAAPLPKMFVVVEHSGLEDVVRVINGVAWALCWIWLSTEVTATTEGVVVRFEGFRPVQVDLNPEAETEDVVDAISLWEWATSSSEAGHRESLQQAITLAVRLPSDLRNTAESILRTARFLLRISQQRLVAEALATRRAARDAALSAVADATQAARDSSRKALDRVLIQLGAVGGIVLANQQALFGQGPALVLLLIVLILFGIGAIAAVTQEFPAIQRSLAAAKLDLAEYREFLDDKEIDALRNLASMKEAERQIETSRVGAMRILLFGAFLVVVAGLWIICDGRDGVGRPGKPERGTPTAQTV